MPSNILQSQVDKAQVFQEVYAEFEEWMVLNKLGTEHKFAILTDGSVANVYLSILDISQTFSIYLIKGLGYPVLVSKQVLLY